MERIILEKITFDEHQAYGERIVNKMNLASMVQFKCVAMELAIQIVEFTTVCPNNDTRTIATACLVELALDACREDMLDHKIFN